MALSNSFTFTLNRDAIITRSLRMIGAISAAQSPTPNEVTAGSDALNLMLKAWQADGMQLWTVTQESVTLTEGEYKLTFGPSGDINVTGQPVEVFEIYRRDTSEVVDVPLIRLAREDYWTLSDKDTKGTPVQFYFDTQINDSLSNLYIWPAGDANFVANNTLEILYQKPFDDMDSGTDNLAFPQTWELAVVYGLAHLMAVEYGLPTTDRRALQQEAMVEKQRVMDWDTEHVSVFLTPEPRFS